MSSKWVVTDIDKFKHYMPLPDDGISHEKGSESRRKRSAIAHDVSQYFTKQVYINGYNVIIEEMYRDEHIAKLKSFFNANDIDYRTVFLSAPLDDVIQRSKSREKVVPEEETRRFYDETRPLTDDFVIDTTKYSSEEAADLIIDQLQAKHAVEKV